MGWAQSLTLAQARFDEGLVYPVGKQAWAVNVML
jgi:hypothetical protein